VPGFSTGRLQADVASIRAKKRRLILVFIFTFFRFLDTIVFYIKESLPVTSQLVALIIANWPTKASVR